MQTRAVAGTGSGAQEPSDALRFAVVAAILALVFAGIAGQLVRLSLVTQPEMRSSHAEPVSRTFARPDIVDRNGRVMATDVAAPSLYADPALILDLDEVVERLAATLPGIDQADLRRTLADKSRRFAWIRRGLTPVAAQRVHDLGLPGLAFRREPKRVYPQDTLAGHILGHVNVDNRGMAGIERYIDETMNLDMVSAASPSRLGPVRLSIDLGAQHALTEELRSAIGHYKAKAAAALIMDVTSGEVLAAVSLPAVDANHPAESLEQAQPDRLQAGVFELGSIFKALTVAMALDAGTATLDKVYDVTQPLQIGKYAIKDLHPLGRPLNVRDIFIHSSNVGAGMIALEAGTERQLVFLARMGLLEPVRTEAGPVAIPLLPNRWDRIETVTVAYGHGLAVAPMQFAAAAAILVNGGHRVTPTFLARGETAAAGERVISPATSTALREIMRLNVTSRQGTGRRAEVAGFNVGGKTGTAEIAGRGGYESKSVISSFVGALPMEAPRYLTFVSLFEPQPAEDTRGGITAGLNAAPVTARIVARVAPILGILPQRLDADGAAQPFDGADDAK